jgi:hypothetical protein
MDKKIHCYSSIKDNINGLMILAIQFREGYVKVFEI